MRATFFVQRECPVCTRAIPMMAKLERKGLLAVTTVDITMNPANEFMDFYDYFCRHLGARHVPVIVLGWPPREVMMVPKYRTVVGRPGKVVGGPIGGLDAQVEELGRMIIKKVGDMKEEPAPYLTHESMLRAFG